jgi:hypothetical protein
MSEATKQMPTSVIASAVPCSPDCGFARVIAKASAATTATPIGIPRRLMAKTLLARACRSAARVGAADSTPDTPVMLVMLRTRAADSIGR